MTDTEQASNIQILSKSAATENPVTISRVDHLQKLADRRFLNNANAWSHQQLINSHQKSRKRTLSHRTKVMRSKRGHESNLNRESAADMVRKLHHQAINESFGNKFIRIYENAKIDFQDFWRRISRTSNLDPYGVITLRPRGETYRTLPIMASTSDVLFTVYDENTYDFILCKCPKNERKKRIKILREVFLKVQIYDYELADDDRVLGTAHIVLRPIKMLDKPYFAVVSLFHENSRKVLSWEGSAEIKCFLTKVNREGLEKIVDAQHIRKYQNMSLIEKQAYLIQNKSSLLGETQMAKSVKDTMERIDNQCPDKVAQQQSIMIVNQPTITHTKMKKLKQKQTSHTPTQSLLLAELDVYETSTTKIENSSLVPNIRGKKEKSSLYKSAKLELQKKRLKSDEKMMELHKAKFKGYLLNIVLFGSLICSGTLFFGWLNLYEVEEQKIYYKSNGRHAFDTLDALHGSIVTATTVGYGDIFPQTTGGKLFGSTFIMFGVSLFARVVGSIFGHIQAAFEHEQKERLFARALSSVENLREFDEDGDGKIDKYEFLKTMLIKRGDVDPKVIDDIMFMFHKYDADGSGFIETDEIRDIIKHDYDQNIAIIIANDKKIMSMQKRNLIDIQTGPSQREYQSDADTENSFTGIEEEKYEESLSDNEEETKEEEETMYYVLNVELIGCNNLRVLDEQAEKTSENFWLFLIALVSVVIYLCFGAMIFSFVEDQDFGSMLWFMVVTSCTVGYGDISPTTDAGKYLNSVMIICNLLLFAYLFTQIFDYIYARQEAIAAAAERGPRKKNVNKLAKKQFKSLKVHLDNGMACEANIFSSVWALLRKHDIEHTDISKNKDEDVYSEKQESRTNTVDITDIVAGSGSNYASESEENSNLIDSRKNIRFNESSNTKNDLEEEWKAATSIMKDDDEEVVESGDSDDKETRI